jgi:tetratricopeptide (TPR) repeat protein
MDRDDTLRRAEKLLRQGRLDTAIEEYASVVEAYPKDWATANLLGDLFIRAGRTDRAVAQYARIAEQLAAEGFLSKAAALYKKIVKIRPDDEPALLRSADLASQQGLLADARHVFRTLFERRASAGDRAGAAEIAERLAVLDPADVVGRMDAARMLSEIGEAPAAAEHLRLAGDSLADQGREEDALRAWREAMRLHPANALAQKRVTSALVRHGDLEEALASAQSVAERRVVATAMLKSGRDDDGLAVLRQVLEAEPDHVDTRLQLGRILMSRQQFALARDLLYTGLQSGDARIDLALAETELHSDRLPAAVTILTRLLGRDPASADHVAALGASLTSEQPDVAFVAVECALDHLVGRGEFERALKIVERFVVAVPRHVAALERFAALCRDGGYEDSRYQVESELTEAYLANRRFAEALPLARRLAALRSDVDRHAAQTSEALAGIDGLTPPAPGPADGDRATIDSFDVAGFAAELGLPVHSEAGTEEGGRAPAQPLVTDVAVTDATVTDAAVTVAEDQPPLADIEAEPAEPLAAPPVEADAPRDGRADDQDVIEIELADALEALLGGSEASLTIIDEDENLQEDETQAEPVPEEADSGGDLDDLFRRMRETSGRGQEEAEAMRAYDEAGVHYAEGRFDQAVGCLRRAGRHAGADRDRPRQTRRGDQLVRARRRITRAIGPGGAIAALRIGRGARTGGRARAGAGRVPGTERGRTRVS